MTINVSKSPSSSPKKKKRRVTVTAVLNPHPFVLPIIKPSLSPLYDSELKHARIDTVIEFYKPSPTIKEAHLAFNDIKRILRPLKKTASYQDPKLDLVFHCWLEGMK